MSSHDTISVDQKVAEQYKKVVDELKLGSEVRESDLTREYETKVSTLKEEILLLTNILKIKDRVSGDIVSSHLKVNDDITQTVEELTKRLEELQKRNKDLNQEKNDLADQLEMLNAFKESLLVENKVHITKKAEIEEEIKKTVKARDALISQIAELTSVIKDSDEEKKKQVADADEEKKKYSDELAAASKTIEEKKKQVDELSANLQKIAEEKKKQVDELSANLQKITEEKKKHTDDLSANLQKVTEEKKKHVDDLSANLQKVTEEKKVQADELLKVIEEKKKQADDLQKVIEKQSDDLLAIQKEIEKQVNANLQLTQEKDKAVLALKDLQDIHKNCAPGDKLISTVKELHDALVEIGSLRAQLIIIEKEKETIAKMRYDIEKDYLTLRASIEKDVKLYHGIPFQPINADEDTVGSAHERTASAGSLHKRASSAGSLHERSSSNSSIDSLQGKSNPEIDILEDESKQKVRKYFSNKKPFTVEFVSEKIKKLKQEDFVSVQALADAFAREILRNNDGQLSYICSDIGKLKFKYIDIKGRTRTDKNLSHLRLVAFPLVEVSIRTHVEAERTITIRQPNDNVIGQLLETLDGVSSKKNKQFVPAFAASLAPKIAYLP